MQWKAGLIAAATVVMLASGPAWAGCMAGDRIDGSTADQAKRQIEAAGYVQVQATKDGAPVNVVLSPQGQVQTEGS